MDNIHIDHKIYQIANTLADAKGLSVDDFIASLVLSHARKILDLIPDCNEDGEKK